MTTIPRIGAPEPFDLELAGARGHFGGLAPTGAGMPRIDYLQTSVCLDSSRSGSRLLQYLKPVREQFSPADLQLDGLMQRDIDDARVAFELIPYLTEARPGFRFFPPIIALVMPVDRRSSLPRDGYGAMTEEAVEKKDFGYTEHRVRFGSESDAELRLRYPVASGGSEVNLSDAVRLDLNTDRVSLVILDGQHRAMALIALWRNLRPDEWENAKASPFKRYYAHWTKDYLESLDLSQVMLPVTVCWIPELSHVEGAAPGADGTVTAAARKLFLALNKNARPVSDARNKLLDDEDLNAAFMRSTIQCMIDSTLHIPPWAIDLDPKKNRVPLTGDLPITGVNQLYHVVDEVLWHGQPLRGISARTFKKGARPRDAFETGVLAKLQAADLLTQEEIKEVSRSVYTRSQEDELTRSFASRYGRIIAFFYGSFAPFALQYEAYRAKAKELRENNHLARIGEIIFGGQSLSEVFQDVTSRLKAVSREHRTGVVPDFDVVGELLESFDEDAKRMEQAIAEGNLARRELMLARANYTAGRGMAGTSVADKVFEISRTTAFQVALVGAFFCMADEFEAREGRVLSPDDRLALARAYLDDLNAFFVPDSTEGLESLVWTFFGGGLDTSEFSDANPIVSNQRFDKLFITGELQPAKWPAYAALLIEIWRPESADNVISWDWVAMFRKARLECRESVVVQAIGTRVQNRAAEVGVPKSQLTDSDLHDIADQVSQGLVKILNFAGALEDGDEKILHDSARRVALMASRGAEAAVADDDIASDDAD